MFSDISRETSLKNLIDFARENIPQKRIEK